MKNKKIVLSIAAGILIAGAVIAWLMLGGEKPVSVKVGDGVSAQLNASLKNSVLQREKDGKKLWQFTVEEVVNDKQKNMAYLKGIKGKVFRSDGSYLDIAAEKGYAEINKNDFALEGNVKAVLNTGGELYADKIVWRQSQELITGEGHVKMLKDAWTATADKAVTTSAFKSVKLKGNAKVVKGGE
ncbi:LPS export ABC transporter periplasmic protein LptC [uncultured Phascolarctobacterium sp.]|uniref:LPS export ABC transporter periplasmic protein LptC n=1 Tax=uncultured Phascolarctobacterium sp. TaxID=512296 RepID=UPI0026006A69|nr:LPS export ABC transporter periplasmic protein LptC [uncultured Phascolarctobacterium sp.]